jgi:hypothetical protein
MVNPRTTSGAGTPAEAQAAATGTINFYPRLFMVKLRGSDKIDQKQIPSRYCASAATPFNRVLWFFHSSLRRWAGQASAHKPD